jgi:hypothetical protein
MDLRFLSRNTVAAERSSYLQRRQGFTFAGRKIWDATEDEVVKRTAGEAIAVTQKLLPHRTSNAIGRRRVKLHILGRKLKQWTTHEDRTLRANIALSYPAIAKILPGRTAHGVQGRAWYLGMRKSCLNRPKAKGLPLYDVVRNRAYEDGMSMRALDCELRTGSYFRANQKKTLNWKKVARAVDFFGGEMTIDWKDV